MPFGLEDKPVEDVVDGLSDERPMYHEFPVDAMQNRLEVVAFSRILAVEELEELEDELLIDVFLGHFCIGVV